MSCNQYQAVHNRLAGFGSKQALDILERGPNKQFRQEHTELVE